MRGDVNEEVATQALACTIFEVVPDRVIRIVVVGMTFVARMMFVLH